jgi:predicted GNAT superfamily acetyltransferase
LSDVRRPLRYVIRESGESDFEALLRLNAESEHFLSPLSLPRLQFLYGQAWYRRVICAGEAVLGFVLGFREVGRQRVAGGKKIVSLQEILLRPR